MILSYIICGLIAVFLCFFLTEKYEGFEGIKIYDWIDFLIVVAFGWFAILVIFICIIKKLTKKEKSTEEN